MACEKQKYTGKDVVLECVIGCGDTRPTPSEWKRMGSMRTKEFGLEWETTDASADDDVGNLRDNLATFQNLTISGDGTIKKSSPNAGNVTEMTKHVANPVATGGQPTAWVRMTFPDLTFTTLMLVTNMSRSAPYDDMLTYSFEAASTASPFGLIVEDTPDPDASDVETVTVAPTTASLAVGATRQLAPTILPPDAPQGVTWLSSASSIATVSQNGLVTAIAAGTATITCRSTSDNTKTGNAAITVTV